MFISCANDTGDKLFGTADKFIGGVIDTGDYLCHRYSLIGGVVDTGDKFITGVIDTAEN
jgi:hypothetical protein